MFPLAGRFCGQYCVCARVSVLTGDVQTRLVQQVRHDFLRVEIFMSNVSRRAAVLLVVAVDGIESGEDVVHSLKGEESFARR